MEGFPHTARLLGLPTPRPAAFSSLNPSMTDSGGLNVPYHLSLAASTRSLALARRNPTTLLGTGEFFSSYPNLQQRLDALTSSSLGLEVASAMSPRSALFQFQNPSVCLSSNDGLMLSRLAAAQKGLLQSSQRLGDRVNASMIMPSANPRSHWPTPAGLVRDANAFSCLPTRSHLQGTSASPMSSTASMLSCAASVAEFALPFSKEEEGQIPLVGGPESFPMVLHRALAELELVGGGRNIATFLPDGRSFYIKNQALFASKILPAFFPKMKSFASFQRQLNLYDFRRVGGAGPDRGAYRHQLFVRDYPAMSSRMRRTKIKGSRPRESSKSSSSSKKEAENVHSTVEANCEVAKISTNDDIGLEDDEKTRQMKQHDDNKEQQPEDKGTIE